MTQKRSKNATEQDYIAQQRAFETSQLGRPTNGYTNVQEMEEAFRKSNEEVKRLNQMIVDEKMREQAEKDKRQREMDTTPYLAELEEVKQQLARKEDDLVGVRELNSKHIDKIRKLTEEGEESQKKYESLKADLEREKHETRFLQEVLGHILTKTQKRWYRANSNVKPKLAKAYALPTDIVMEYVEEDTAHMFERRYEERKERFKREMKGTLLE